MSLVENNLFSDDCGYVEMISHDKSDRHVPNVSYIGKNPNVNLFEDDYFAQDQAVMDGVELLTGFTSIPDNVYLDTLENRRRLEEYFIENPEYAIVDTASLSELVSECFNRYLQLNNESSLKEFANLTQVSLAHLAGLMDEIIIGVPSDVINNLVNNTDIDNSKLFACVEPVKEKFIY